MQRDEPNKNGPSARPGGSLPTDQLQKDLPLEGLMVHLVIITIRSKLFTEEQRQDHSGIPPMIQAFIITNHVSCGSYLLIFFFSQSQSSINFSCVHCSTSGNHHHLTHSVSASLMVPLYFRIQTV